MSASLQSLKYSEGSLSVLEQKKLPFTKEYIEVKGVEDAWKVIREMSVRGAPLIAIVASFGLAVECFTRSGDSLEEEVEWVKKSTSYLRTSRPTAVNLFGAMDMVDELCAAASSAQELRQKIKEFAEKLYEDDLAANKSLGKHGALAILDALKKKEGKERKVTLMTICNTGSLACAGYGTALGVIRAMNEMGMLEKVYALETRPYNQGARLTAFEFVEDNLPGTLITDGMCAHVMKTKGVDAVIVGADRVAKNGDTANKIGTYQASLCAHYHKVPFFVAAPTTTLDEGTACGDDIVIEERGADEVRSINGVKIAPDNIPVFNPAFDVTPSAFINGIVTEKGVIFPKNGEIDISIPLE